MQSRWVDRDANAAIDRFAAQGISPELALRVYTTRLLGGDAALVLHGGGNTSVKTKMRDLAGDEVEVLCIKGTGGNMGTIEPSGMAAVRLAPLQRLRTLDDLSDDDMARGQRGHLLDPMAPSPSLELLLHAFMPHKFVDHTHANAVLSLIDQPDGAKLCEEVYDGRVGLVPYVRPGFGLAKAAATTFDKNPKVEGLILDKHGIFSFGTSAKESYERMIELVSRAEERLKQNRKAVFKSAQLPQQVPPNDDIAPFIRGACSLKDAGGEGAHRRMILEYRSNDAILNFINGAELKRYGASVVITPDFTIRTKSLPLIAPTPQAGKLDDFKRAAHDAVTAYIDNYKQYFARHNARSGGGKKMVDPLPRIVLVPGLGLYGLGRSAKDASIAADLAEAAVATITDAEAIGRFQSLTEADMFDTEYWPIEQAKLGKEKALPLAGQVAVNSRSTNTVQGDIQNASISTYMAVNGDGYFVVEKPTGFSGSTPAFGCKNGFLTAGALVSGSSILNDSPILYLRHISSPSASGNASWRRTTTAVAATTFAVGSSLVAGSLVTRNVWANASGAPLLISYASTS